MLKIEKIELIYSDLGHVLGMKALVKNMEDKALELWYVGHTSSKRSDEIFDRKGKGETKKVVLQPDEEKEITITLDPAITLEGTFSVGLVGAIQPKEKARA